MLKKVTKLFSTVKPIVITLIIVGLIFHFIYLGSIPVGLTHDDADVVVSMKTIAENGVDVSGVSFPSLLFFNKTQGNISGLFSFLISPLFKVYILNLFNIQFIYVLLNLISLILLSFLSYLLTKNDKLPFYVYFVGLLNPWFFVYSRYPTEAPVALFFVLLGLVFFYSHNIDHYFKKYYLIFSSIFFVASFYSYYGAKVVVILLFPALCFIDLTKKDVSLINFKKFILPLMLFLIPVLFYFCISFFSTNSTMTKRLGNEFIFKNMLTFENQTNDYRKISIDTSLKNIFFNKYVFLGESVLKKYTGWMSPNILFFEGDPVSVYRFSDHGLFYILDMVLFLLGLLYLSINLEKNKDLIKLCLVLIIVGPIGSSISNIGTSYFFRSFSLIPALLILISLGFLHLEGVLNKLKTSFFFNMFLLLYLILFLRFCTFYFLRYPVYSQENNFFSERILSSYVNRAIGNTQSPSVSISNPESFRNLDYFYNGIRDKNRLIVSNICNLIKDDSFVIYDTTLNCQDISGQYLVIEDQKDAGARFKIFNDKICRGYSLNSYKRNHLISDYAVERMNDEDFCNRWIQKGN